MLSMERLLTEIYRFTANGMSIMVDVRRGVYGEASLLQELLKRPVVPDRNLKINTDRFLLNSIYLHISDKCPLRCTYCYLDSDNPDRLPEMTEKQIDKLIFFVNNSPAISDQLTINFLGREPLENFEQIQYTVERLEELQGKKFHYTIGTNGLLLDHQEVISFLYKYFSSVVVSLDGNETLHNKTRRYHNGNGSYAKIAQNIAFLTDRPQRLAFGLRAIIGAQPERDELQQIVRHHQTFHPDTIFIDLEKTPEHWSPERITVTKDAIAHLWQYFLEKAEEGVILPIRHILVLLRKVASGRTVAYNCDAGTTSLYMTSDGKFYPCGELANQEQWEIGSLSGRTLQRERFLAHTVQNRAGCQECWARYICGGKCYADQSGTCEILQFEIQLAMYTSLYLAKHRPDVFMHIYDLSAKKNPRGLLVG